MDLLKGFVRDPVTKAVINKDDRDYKDHIFKMDVYKEICELRSEVQFLREELEKTKALMANSEEKN